MQNNASGRRWARFGLGLGAVLSVLGNETHTVLVSSTVNLIIRVVLAFIWPAALFVAVEVFVRVAWREQMIDWFGRIILLGPVSAVAAVVSYQHIHALMILGGEDDFSALIGPLAIDGLMLGSTVALLAIRAAAIEPVEQELDAIDRDWSTTELVPVSPAPIGTTIHDTTEKHTRRPRGTVDPHQVVAVRMLINGADKSAIVQESAISPATYGRLSKVYRTLRDNPNAVIDAATEKVRPELIDMMRESARLESVR
jgi:hypothetical protein